ncbi:MAG: hypothetical protein JWL79_3281 [Frankiales bacterium]|nr:hypothetical protein [Frankiales bacterium]
MSLTDGPAVTVIDPHAGPVLPAAVRPRWGATERTVALVAAVVLLAGLVSAGHLRTGTADGGLSATSRGSKAQLGRPSALVLDLVVTGPPVEVRLVRPDRGWVLVDRAPTVVGAATDVVVSHTVVCDRPVPPPSRLQLVTIDGRRLGVPVHVAKGDLFRSTCDPWQGAQAMRLVTSSLTRAARTRVQLGLVDVSTRPLTLDQVRYGGFAFAADLPVRLAGRDSRGPLDLDRLTVTDLTLVTTVQECGAARRALDAATANGTPDRLPATVDGAPADLEVRGLEAYLELQWRATCVR